MGLLVLVTKNAQFLDSTGQEIIYYPETLQKSPSRQEFLENYKF